MKKNYFLTLVLVFGIALTATSQTYGVFTETTATDDAFLIDDVTGHLYVWNNLVPYTETPQEGTEVLAFEASAAAWFGFGIASDVAVDLSAYTNGYLNFAIKIPASNATDIKVMMTDTYGNEAVVWLNNGVESYGMVRDGNWHFINIPAQDFIAGGSLDISSLENIFAIAGDMTTAGALFAFDNVYYSTAVPTNVSLPEEAASSSVYPNPADESVTISLGGNASAVSVVDLSGKVVYAASDVAGLDKLSVDVSAWNNGVYMVMVELSNGSKEVKKLMVN